MILVTGATGTAGSHVVRALTARGASVRVLTRDPTKAERLFGPAVEVVPGDFAAPATLAAALAGAEQLLLSCADDPRRVQWETAAIDAAVAAGVRRIVRLSAIGAEPASPVAFWDWHGRIDAYLRQAPVASVILRPGPFMSNLLMAAAHVAQERMLLVPAGDARMAMIDPRDVGAAAAAVLLAAGGDGATHVLTGPAAITYDEVAAELAAATGDAVTYASIPDAAAREALAAQGLPEAVAGHVVDLFGMLRGGAAEQVTPAVEALTGRPPGTFRAWARDHAALFAPVPVPAR